MNAIWSVFVLLTLENRWSLKQDFLAWSIIATMIVELSELCSEVEGYTVKNSNSSVARYLNIIHRNNRAQEQFHFGL